MITTEDQFEEMVEKESHLFVYSGVVPLPANYKKKIEDCKCPRRILAVRKDGNGHYGYNIKLNVGNFLMAYVNHEPKDVIEIDELTTENELDNFIKDMCKN